MPAGAGMLIPMYPQKTQATMASNTLPQNASLSQQIAANGLPGVPNTTGGANTGAATNPGLPSLPPPKNSVGLTMTGATLTPSGYEATYGRDPIADAQAQADIRNASREKALSSFAAAINGLNGQPIGGGGASDADLEAARRAEYTRARETIGNQKLGALKSFQDAMLGSGMQGSTLESGGVGDILSGAEHELGDVVMGQAQSRVNRLDTEAARRADMLEQRRRDALNALSQVFTSSGSLY